jgi:hypothetical protein
MRIDGTDQPGVRGEAWRKGSEDDDDEQIETLV